MWLISHGCIAVASTLLEAAASRLVRGLLGSYGQAWRLRCRRGRRNRASRKLPAHGSLQGGAGADGLAPPPPRVPAARARLQRDERRHMQLQKRAQQVHPTGIHEPPGADGVEQALEPCLHCPDTKDARTARHRQLGQREGLEGQQAGRWVVNFGRALEPQP